MIAREMRSIATDVAWFFCMYVSAGHIRELCWNYIIYIIYMDCNFICGLSYVTTKTFSQSVITGEPINRLRCCLGPKKQCLAMDRVSDPQTSTERRSCERLTDWLYLVASETHRETYLGNGHAQTSRRSTIQHTQCYSQEACSDAASNC